MISLADHIELPDPYTMGWSPLPFIEHLNQLPAGKRLKAMVKAPIAFWAKSKSKRLLELRQNGQEFSSPQALLYVMATDTLVQPYRSIQTHTQCLLSLCL